MNGFKSFASRTKLDFEPGLTAIVGPNGCGKSNISDAVRWVLGEMSAKAMRGSSMEDVIFNGTDDHKPLGMAEVSLTLADCENVLATEFNEVTITRRVFRSGEGQYFINKTPCRLRDIHRLFMDTGIGTTSYSMMEQGRIDRILSARPEDRRAVFEEASGITKYKSDKKEAIRKLEHTEANLLRLADVIREVKRQIGSLQRQAGKARRYKDARDELRKLDLYLTGQKLRQADAMIKSISDRAAGWIEQIASGETEVAALEAKLGSLRETLSSTEHEMSAAHEAQMQAQAGLDHTREMMEMNRQRIDEYRAWTERDTREAADVSVQLAEKEALLRALEARTASCRSEWQEAEAAMKACQARHARQVEAMDSARSLIHKMRDESVQLESLATRLQNRIVEMDTRERSALIRRERLAAEKSGLTELAAEYERRREEMVLALAGMARDVEAAESELKRVTAEQDAASSSAQAANEELAQARASASAAKAQVDIIEKHRDSLEPFPAGARMLLDAANPLELDSSSLSGALALHVETDPELRIALEAALRAWGDAVVVRDSAAARAILAKLCERGAGAARLVSCEPAGGATEPEDALIHKVSCPAGVRPAVAAALAGVRLADSLDSVPSDIPSGTTWVTRGGAVVRGNCFEHWSAETPTATPLTVKHAADTARAALEDARTAAAAAEARLAECAARIRELGGAIQNARAELDSRRRAMAQKEGEQQALSRESAEARRKLETVSFEFDSISEATRSGVEERQAIHRERDAALGRREGVASDIQARTSELHDLENEHSRIQGELVELRVRCGGMQNALENAESQRESATARVAELQATAAARAGSIENYRRGSETLERTNTEAQSRLERLSQEVSENGTRLETLAALRAEQSAATEACASLLAEKRKTLDTVRAAKADTDIQLAEHRMRRQNQIDRTTSEYGVSLDQIINWPEPEWPEGAPSFESIETQVAEIRLKIEAMGPVNLVAIEEYSELEERHTFLAKQEADLVQAKEQLMDMIRQINKTTSDLFADTFAKINENFQKMFTRLFNGGSAKLVLVNEEDILECGIEIIGRPPGKKLQNISLLSGGERTLTAVALLFAIYMIKPSPFCLLDELDAPLDDSNIGRFIDVLRDFLSQSQFLIITHNQHTISAANILYGVTMPEKGVSKMVSMRFRKREEQERAQQLAPA